MTVDFEKAKVRIIELIDKWSNEVINDLLKEIKSAADNCNIRDIELTLDNIHSIEKQTFNVKQSILKSSTTRQLFLSIDCEVFEDVEEIILSKFLNTDIQINKN